MDEYEEQREPTIRELSKEVAALRDAVEDIHRQVETLKADLVHHNHYSLLGRGVLEDRDRTEQAKKARKSEYIELYYNTRRMHSSLGYKSPLEYERQSA